MGAIQKYYINKKVRNPEAAAIDYKEAFEAMMEGAAMMLDLVGQIEYTYTTKSGNKVHALLDSP